MIVKIDGFEIIDYMVNELTLNYDTVSDVFALTTPYFEHWEVSRKMFKPLKYQKVEIFDNKDRKLLTGIILNYNFKETPSSCELSFSGYSKTGILDDCPNVANSLSQTASVDEAKDPGIARIISAINGPSQIGGSSCYAGLSLKQLAEILVAPFGIEVYVHDIVKDKMDEPYEQSTTTPDETVAAYLAKLATLKNVVMRSSAYGRLLFTQLDTTTPIDDIPKFFTGDGRISEISMQVNGQAMHSDIYVIGRANLYPTKDEDGEKVGDSAVIKNPLILAKRPTLKTQGTEISMIKDVSKSILADELKNITVSIECKGWNIIDDSLLLPGALIRIKAPGIYLYDFTTFLVRSIKLSEDANGKKSTLTCMLPETMTGEQPKLIFG